jgi:protease-4
MRAVLAALLIVSTSGCSVISVDLTPRLRPLVEETVEGRGPDKILLMEISGFISDDTMTPTLTIGTPPPSVSMLVRVREELKKATKDPRIKAVVLRINSPGGTVTASDIVYREIQAFKAETKIPVVAVMLDVAASGGYYVALAADRIIAHPTSVTGSIGVLMLTINTQGLLEKVGVAASTIKSGPRKDMGSPFRELTPEERAIFQTVIDELHSQFVAKVVDRRGIPAAAARGLADGRVYSGPQALAERLVDQVGYVEDAVAAAKQAAGLDDARVVIYHRPREYRATYYAGAATPAPRLESALAQITPLLGGAGPKLLYLWWP